MGVRKGTFRIGPSSQNPRSIPLGTDPVHTGLCPCYQLSQHVQQNCLSSEGRPPANVCSYRAVANGRPGVRHSPREIRVPPPVFAEQRCRAQLSQFSLRHSPLLPPTFFPTSFTSILPIIHTEKIVFRFARSVL